MQENSVNSARYMHMMIHCWVVFKYVPIPIIESAFLNVSWGSFRAGAEVRRCLHSSSSRLLCKTSGEMTRDIKRHQETRSCTENQVSRLKWIRLNKYFLYQRYTLDHFSVLNVILCVLSAASISTDSNKPLKPVASAADFLDCSWRRALKSDFHVNSSTQRASNFHASSSCSKASFLTDWNEESMETLAPWASSLKKTWSLQLWSSMRARDFLHDFGKVQYEISKDGVAKYVDILDSRGPWQQQLSIFSRPAKHSKVWRSRLRAKNLRAKLLQGFTSFCFTWRFHISMKQLYIPRIWCYIIIYVMNLIYSYICEYI